LTQDAAPQAPAPRTRRIRLAGAALVVALALLIAWAPRWTDPLREAWFDGYQRTTPRVVGAMPAVIVEIDAKSLAALGRWPWPRSTLAELVARVAAMQPAVVGIDILMPEPDPLSPERLLRDAGAQPPARASELAALPTHDGLLARAMAATPTVLAVAGMPEPTGMLLRAPPFVVEDSAGATRSGALDVEHFAGALGSIDAISAAASGWGLVSAEPADGVIRRLPMLADIGGTLIGALAIEMFRVAAREPSLRLLASGSAVRGIAIGNAFVATAADGYARVYFSRRHPDRFVSAVDVLRGRADPAQLAQKLVLIAVTGVGLGDYYATPVGERMPGSEIHAQLIENLYEGTLLDRPAWAPFVEATGFALLGALLVWATPLWKPRNSAGLALACCLVAVGTGCAAFRTHHLLLDAATPVAGLALAFGAMLLLTLAEATRHRHALERVVQHQREHAARIAGELDAARRIQMAMLPRAELLADEPRVDLAATMLPAREVGGDLYDFYMLDAQRLFFLVGDVAGKGLSASIFMAVSKALYKSTTLRSAAPDMGALMTAANAEVSRDNPQMLFVTVFAGLLDLDTGELAYCNAGHENPCRIHPADTVVGRIVDGDGPPLCVADGFAYRGAHVTLRPGEALCLVSDGVTEAHDPSGELFGNARLESLLLGLRSGERSAHAIVEGVCNGVATFVASAEASDDLTVLVLRWCGRAAGAA
jgi:serine phosphatase RsbU (regulator of sigma subunit)/CHASE2 domain-containing sensor protein